MGYPQALQVTGFGAGSVVPSSFSADAVGTIRNGIETQRAAAALPQSAVGSLFTVAGGKVRILEIYGEVTTVIQTQANNTKLQAKATGQTAVDMCAVLDITAKAVGIILAIPGAAASAMVAGFAVPAQAAGWIMGPGTIDLNCAASNTGAIKWVVRWSPIDAGATLVAA